MQYLYRRTFAMASLCDSASSNYNLPQLLYLLHTLACLNEAHPLHYQGELQPLEHEPMHDGQPRDCFYVPNCHANNGDCFR